jgi:hypothetical protein
MKWAALVTWIATAGFGFVLLAMWLARGGMRQARETGGRIRPPLILSHFGLAAAGLVLWIVYLAKDKDVLAWIAFGALAVVAVLGWTMFAIWARQRSARATGPAPVPGSPAGGAASTPEQNFPVPVVALHGLLAVTTVVLVFLTAVGVGGS